MKKKPRFYVVWIGRQTGIFDTWEDCREQVHEFVGAKYKAYSSREEATTALKSGYESSKKKASIVIPGKNTTKPLLRSICVDAACSVEKQLMEYRGVFIPGGKVLFHRGPYEGASNNIGEFLAVVHAMAWMKEHKVNYPIYTDSNTALTWIKNKVVKTKIQVSPKTQFLLDKALQWLNQNTTQYSIIKWDTAAWGEIPADFGRK